MGNGSQHRANLQLKNSPNSIQLKNKVFLNKISNEDSSQRVVFVFLCVLIVNAATEHMLFFLTIFLFVKKNVLLTHRQ